MLISGSYANNVISDIDHGVLPNMKPGDFDHRGFVISRRYDVKIGRGQIAQVNPNVSVST